MKRRGFSLLIAALALFAAVPPTQGEEPMKAAAVGEKIANSDSLLDLHGNRRSLNGFTGHKAVVLFFCGAECPISNLYVPAVLELEKRYRSKQVQFIAVYANEREDLDQIAGHAYDRDLPFPALKDCGQRLAALAGIARLPAVVVLDDGLSLRYRGRVDDRYGAGSRRPQATRNDLGEALDEVLAGKKVSVPETEVDGCLLDHGKPVAVKNNVTFTKQVAPILQQRCQACHREGQSAPFALMNYDDAVKHAAMIREVTTQRRMPPWQADPRYGHFSNDRRLTRKELDTLTAWIDGGMARGDDKDSPAPIQWTQGWVHGKPDLVFTMPEEFAVPADGVVPYKNWIIDTGFTEDKWVQIAEARPGTPSVVHHIVVYILKEGQRGPINRDGSLSILVGWAPGDLGLVCPPNVALRVPKGAKLRFEMHYTPDGKVVKDRSSIGITFASKPPKNEMVLADFTNMSFEVPPGDSHYKAEASLPFPADARILSFAPHMHWRGQDYSYELIYPDGKHEMLLSVPRWDFNWQNVYRFEEPVKVPKGARLHAVAHWDNSVNNPLNPDPTKSAKFGLQTWEEMMVGFVAYVWEQPGTAEELAKNPPSMADKMFERLDVKGEGVVTADQIPPQMQAMLLLKGVKVPDKMSREEFGKFFEDVRKQFQRPKPDPGKSDVKNSTP